MLLFALIVAFMAGLMFGIVPAIGAARIPIANALKTNAATAFRDPSRVTGGNATAVLQIALCLALLVGTGLLLRTLQKLESVDVGFRPAKLLVFGISPHLRGEAERVAFYRTLTDRLRSLPLVEWFPYTQTEVSGEMQVELRIAGDPITLLPQVREVVANFAPDLALLEPRTQKAEFEETIASQRILAKLSVSFAVLAALLIAIGLYGTTSYQVARRTSELGIRMALGAERKQVMWMIFRNALLLSSLGLSIGVTLTLMSSRVLVTLLFQVQPNDFISLASAVLGILAITIGATVVPALRAAGVDPLVALRQE